MRPLTRVLAFALTVFILSGCGKDDPKPVSKLVGKWEVKNTQPTITVPGGDLRQYLIAEIGMGPEEADTYVIYLQSGDAAGIDVSTIEFKSDGSYESTDNANVVLTGKWELSSDEKKLTVDKATTHELVITVKTLDDANLEMEFDFSDAIALPNLKYVVLLTLEKV